MTFLTGKKLLEAITLLVSKEYGVEIDFNEIRKAGVAEAIRTIYLVSHEAGLSNKEIANGVKRDVSQIYAGLRTQKEEAKRDFNYNRALQKLVNEARSIRNKLLIKEQ
jgi:hypothetical protein